MRWWPRVLCWVLVGANGAVAGAVEQAMQPRAIRLGHLQFDAHLNWELEDVNPIWFGQLTVTVYPALGSEIAVRQIEVVGNLDIGQGVLVGRSRKTNWEIGS